MRRLWPLALALALWAGAVARDGFDAWVAATDLPPLLAETSAEVLDRQGRLLRAYTVADGRWRLAVSPDEVDPLYLRMLIAWEDRRFHDHSGVDGRALLRAAWQAIRAGRIVSGGSTLSMQVARLVEDGPTGTVAGKLRQIRVALALERRLTKAQILDLYLDRAPFGANIEGLRAATRAWFGKDPRRLTPAEAALMVALPQAPGRRRPDRFPEAAEAARNRVLDRMVRLGVIDADRARAARREPLPGARRPMPALAPHLADRLRAEAPRAAVIRTTLDADLQAALERLAAEAVRGRGERLSAAILVLDHRTGEVLASVGSAGYLETAREGFVDMTRALRSPGSALKPFVYGLAFDEGLAHPATLIEDRPADFGGWRPQNFDGAFRGTVTVREALQASLNLPVVRLLEAVGPARLMAALRRAGARPVLPGGAPGLAVALGGVGVTLEDLAALYAALGAGGRPVALRYRPEDPVAAGAAAVLSAEAAWHVADILQGVPPPAGRPWNRLAYKTGTSYGHRDALAVGFDGAHAVAVWMGRADGTPVPGAFGAESAAPVLFDAFARLKPRLDPLPPPPPATLTVGTALLPEPLQRFRGRDAAFGPAPDAPRVAFPPDGAEVEAAGRLLVRVAEGTPPFTWLADGLPVAVARHDREEIVEGLGPGFLRLTVIDARGRSAAATVRLR